jgi:hypothetical protein
VLTEADWLTEEEVARLLAAAEHPPRRRAGLAEHDRLILLTVVQTGLRRAELIALDWPTPSATPPPPRAAFAAPQHLGSTAVVALARRGRLSRGG